VQPDRILDLSPYAPIAEGSRQWVYEVPTYPGMILKVQKIDKDAPPQRPIKKLIRWVLPGSEWRTVTVEPLSLALANIMKPDVAAEVFPRFHGFVLTSLGVGSLQEKLTGQDGGLAPTLAQLRDENQLAEHHKLRLSELARRMDASHIVVNDIHAKNLVFSQDRFFIVDGVGDRNVVRLRSLSPGFNRRSQNRKWAAMSSEMGWSWDPQAQRFI
jgi:hypothetical protein